MQPATIIPFPAGRAPCPPAAGAPAGRRYRLADVARLLGFEDLPQRALIAQLRALARLDGMPLPINPRLWAGSVLRDHRAIYAGSKWDAPAFDAWRYSPRSPVPSAAPPVPPGLHSRMAQRARQLAATGPALTGAAQ